MATRNGVAGARLFWDIIHPGCQNFPTGLHALRGSVLVVAALTSPASACWLFSRLRGWVFPVAARPSAC